MGLLEDVVINAKSAANAVGKGAAKLYDVSRLKISAADLNNDICKHFEALGRIVYDAKKTGENNDALVEDSIRIIDDLYSQQEAIEQQIAELKNVVKCPSCGFENAQGSCYCNCCGSKINSAAAPAEEDEACNCCGEAAEDEASCCHEAKENSEENKEE